MSYDPRHEMDPNAPDDIRLSRFGALRGCFYGLIILFAFGFAIWFLGNMLLNWLHS